MAGIKFLLLLSCVALSAYAGTAPAKSDSELEAEAESEGATEVDHALMELQRAVGNSHEPWAKRLDLAREALAPVLAALEEHTATVLLHSRHRLDALRPELQKRLDEVRALLAQSQQELVADVTERGGAALAGVAAAVTHAREELASLWPAPASSDSGAQ